ncbi:alpha-N-acetylglucosaminidase [Salix suchowensis]|nr:alpha-N-acetylglucosaminidase [Salix suchowensis]
MDSSPLAAVSLVLLASFLFFFSSAQSSTIGVSYISELLEIQDRERALPHVQVAATRGVLQRLLPSHTSSFEFRIVSKEQCGGESCFIIKNHPSFTRRGAPQILISGVTGVEVLAGLHWYLKYWCGSHISWDKTGDDGILVQRPVPWNYYSNAVTSSYSFAWWDWKRWEKEIDWMALQGINLPLAFTGQEAIWQKVFQKFNNSKEDLDDFFGGPAFLAWSRMANLHRWGGPLPQSWFDQQLILQKKILARMYELGMTPVLPAFSGNVPAALRNIFPSAKITRLGNWFSVRSDARWCCTYLLDATDPLFIEIGRAFIETSHIYNCDTFDENTPPVDDPEYISSLGGSIFEGMQSGDSNAVWLMQGWLFSYDPFWRPPQTKALLHSVPIGRLVVLDLFAEVKPIWITSEQFYAVPYIWCMLHNFAGNLEMYGHLDSVASGPVEARTSENSTMVGVGMSMEGIEQNPVAYDLMSEMAFDRTRLMSRRYGRSVPTIQYAWNILYHTVYNCTDGAYDKNRDVIVAFPDVDPYFVLMLQGRHRTNGKPVSRRLDCVKNSDSYDHPHLWYSTTEAVRALELFIAGGDELSGSSTYRQVLAKYANELFLKVIESYRLKDRHGVAHQSQMFLDLVEDMDTLLACHEGFLLGPWLESAKQLAQDEEQQIQFEWNARTQITMWYDNTEVEASLLRDYGNKYWSGLLKDYYGPRAAIYFNFISPEREWIKLTNNWQKSRKIFPVESNGNALNISRWLYYKYLGNPDTYDH